MCRNMRSVLNHKRKTVSRFPGVCEGNVDPRLYGDDVAGTEGLALGHAAAVVHVHTLNIEFKVGSPVVFRIRIRHILGR